MTNPRSANPFFVCHRAGTPTGVLNFFPGKTPNFSGYELPPNESGASVGPPSPRDRHPSSSRPFASPFQKQIERTMRYGMVPDVVVDGSGHLQPTYGPLARPDRASWQLVTTAGASLRSSPGPPGRAKCVARPPRSVSFPAGKVSATARTPRLVTALKSPGIATRTLKCRSNAEFMC